MVHLVEGLAAQLDDVLRTQARVHATNHVYAVCCACDHVEAGTTLDSDDQRKPVVRSRPSVSVVTTVRSMTTESGDTI